MLYNKIKHKLKRNEPCVGLISNLPSPHLTEIFGISGFEFIVFDLEHSAMSEETLEGLVRASKLKNLVPLARVQKNDPSSILRVLDAGCLGVMVPNIETREEARKAVSSARYRPDGIRGINWKVTASEWGAVDPIEYARSANENILTIIQIETVEGVRNLESILDVEGIDVIIVGPADLSASMGHPGDPGNPDVQISIEKVIGICKKSNVAMGIGATTDKEKLTAARENGALLFYFNPAEFILEHCFRLVEDINAGLFSKRG